MISYKDIKDKAGNKFLHFLRSLISGEDFFSLIITGNKKPSDNIADFKKEVIELEDNSKNVKGYGYSVTYEIVKTKKYGEQSLPQQIFFSSEEDYLKFIGKTKEVLSFRKDTQMLLSQFPELQDWIIKYPQKVIDNNGKWDGIIKVCNYFRNNPKPNLYIRELPVEVHTKFIEQNKGVIRELLDIIIADSINADKKDFEQRFNLKYEEPLVRFRILDDRLSEEYFSNMNDITIPLSKFVSLSFPVDKIFVVENKMNMLTFPLVEKSIVVWGSGFKVEIMEQVTWLKNKQIYYWGDLDAQGFEILSNARSHFPQIVSFLMDRQTFDDYFENDFGTLSKVSSELCLSDEEKEVYNYVKFNNFRLEQEKIPQSCIADAINNLIQ